MSQENQSPQNKSNLAVAEAKLPNHLAIIMDGNGRWAQNRGRDRVFGHVKGTRIAKKIITECSHLKIKNLTLYAFSSENWFRPQFEVSFLMRLLSRYLKRETQNLIKENIRFRVIGDMSRLPENVRTEIEAAIDATSVCTGLNLVFALSYGSRQEITDAVKDIATLVAKGQLNVRDIDEEMVSRFLSTYPTPDPDLIIRTSGEYRLSNFLMWQAAYSEFYFCDTLWPDFSVRSLHEALSSFAGRQRRFGKVKDDHENVLR